MTARTVGFAAIAWAALCAPPALAQPAEPPAEPADPAAPAAELSRSAEPRARFNLEAVQGILAVQKLGGWLLYDRAGQNPIARELVQPAGDPIRRWFYFIPAKGQPVALVHRSEAASFERVPGRVVEYTGYRDLDKALRQMLKGTRTVAMEYSPKAALPSLSRVDAGTVDLVRSLRVQVRSSADLVQFAKALWGPEGRKAHYVAAHHLAALREQALAWVAGQIEQNRTITEHDVQQFILRGYRVRGLEGRPPVVAVNANTARPQYQPTAADAAPVRRGDLLLIEMAARPRQGERSIYATTTWMAYVGESVPDQFADAFAVAARGRDAAVELITDRVTRRRPIKGYEVDQKARDVIAKAGHGDRFVHGTGHSIDTTEHGDGANLDDYETRDTRILVQGAGFAIAPGIYFKGEFGVRTSVNVYVGRKGVEVTSPAQAAITPILGRKQEP